MQRTLKTTSSVRFSGFLLLFLIFRFSAVLSDSSPSIKVPSLHCMKSFRIVSRAVRVHGTISRKIPSAFTTTTHFGNLNRSTRSALATAYHSRSISLAAMADLEGSSKYTPYEKWVRRLYQTNLFNPVKLGLQNMEDLHEAMGRPMDHRPVIHIAGTNGKGSVALKIATTLQLLNPALRVGLFCSPHVSSFRERMQINGEMIPEDKVVAYLPEIYETCIEKDIPATFFEITTALAFKFFQEADVVVLETGLGGRLDATNVISTPALSIITSIGLEHTRILGDTVEKIALEKGGIIKKGRPVLVGPNVPHIVLRECAKEKGASKYFTCDDVLGTSQTEITDYDKENARTAEAALAILKEDHPNLFESLTDAILEEGTSIRPPCRFEIIELDGGLTVILDVAHNPPAMEYLLRKLQTTYPDSRFRIVVGMSADKDVGLVGKMLLDVVDVDAVHLVEAYHPRAAKLEAILEADPRLEKSNWDSDDRTITSQIKFGMEIARAQKEILVVCGSVFLMAEAREALGFDEPRDSKYIAEVAGAHLRHGQEVFANTPDVEEKAN
jgi:dihydrofolate synthase/folylpolyglutamate synthase